LIWEKKGKSERELIAKTLVLLCGSVVAIRCKMLSLKLSLLTLLVWCSVVKVVVLCFDLLNGKKWMLALLGFRCRHCFVFTVPQLRSVVLVVVIRWLHLL